MSARVLVIGGGMVGLAFAIAVRRALPDATVSVLEARPFPDGNPDPLDTRASALNLASRDILLSWGVWGGIEPAAGVIRQIHVSNQRRFGSSVMTPADVGEDQLGFVAENHTIGRAFKAVADALQIQLRAPAEVSRLLRSDDGVGVELAGGEALHADLVIVADGSQSRLREQLGVAVDIRRTGQRAVVANVSFAGQQQGTAFERFTKEGPLALLPLVDSHQGQQRFNLVWSMSEDKAHCLEAANDAEFMAELQQAFGWRLGRIMAVGKRSAWTLDRVRAREQVRPGVVVAGNAAHGIHPVAGQGLNLSLRDAAMLGRIIALAGEDGTPPGDPVILSRYESCIREDQDLTVGATDMLSTLFTPRGVLMDLPRDVALASLDFVPVARRAIARRGTGKWA